MNGATIVAMRRPLAIFTLLGMLLACGTAQQISKRTPNDALIPRDPVRGKNGAVAGGTAASVDAGMSFAMGPHAKWALKD